ncbi:MAG TPA: thiamine pyrophosphate-requiring protein [Sandaracinaceae bacterium LLY-WYZ-13_1]|nr:thiamine pyrophosphate-requiring protein [Sandaracinaceae bacterium LLY-WYZ-13_1]
MSQNVSEYLLERLHTWGVERIYGYPGDGINGIMGALEKETERLRFVQTRHEELAAFMAAAHAKFTGTAGVCLATSGPGAIHLLNGLYDASMDHQPVVAIVGQQASTAIGTDYQQEVDLQNLFGDVAHHYCKTCFHPSQIRHLVDRAMRIAMAERTVTCIIIPNDVQTLDYAEPPRSHGACFSGPGWRAPRIVPREDDLDRAAQILNEGERVAILAGAGAFGAAEELHETAEKLGAGVAKALLGKAVMADDLPYVTGSIGLLGTEPSDEMMQGCDTLLMVGTSFPYSEWLPKEGQARCVQIDIKPRMLSIRYPADVPLCGDARETLKALLPRLERKEDRGWRETIEKNVAKWWKLMEDRAMEDADPINPQRVFWELSPRLPERAVITADSGSSANWFARDLKIRPGMMASLSGNLATMGPGVPYGIAAKFCHPDRPVIACVGDGAMQMNGLNGLITVQKYWKEWKDPRFICFVLNNRDLNQVTWEQRVMEGDPRFDASQVLPPFDFAEYGRSLGFEGVKMETPDDIASGWERALNADKPVVVDAIVDPEVPPLPPHIKFDQAKQFMFSVLGGDPNRGRMIEQSAKHMRNAFKPGR